ncbi:hypothetical protein QOZ23_04640 [Pseudomonas aeruginosa]|uniref:hypothetical protein n=1 Tax=Pseudomonas aeruginosa TaxID=287 RepID=UPI00345845FC
MRCARLLPVLFAAACAATGAASHAADCAEIRFKRGERSAVVTDAAPADGSACWRFRAGDGQAVRLSVTSEHDQVAFSVAGLVDDRADYAFTSKKQPYTVQVHQTMRAVSPVPYSLTLSID